MRTSRESHDPYYDLIADFGLIVASFRAQYGLRLRGELADMPWDEFQDLLAGLGNDTPLGRIVAIRSESDPEILKQFSPEQHRIRNEWQRRLAKQKTPEQTMAALEGIKKALIAMAGGVVT